MKKTIFFATAFMLITYAVRAQHEHHMPAKDSTKPAMQMPQNADTVPHGQHDHNRMQHQMASHEDMGMSHAFSRNLPMTRNGSGTAWLPDNAPMYAYMFHTPKWMYMLHGDVFLRYNKQDVFNKGKRGGEKWDAPNMVMLMGQRNVGKNGLFHFNTMVSLDPVTVGNSGYPLLFQTGESYKGVPLVDRQHPHDLFSELSVSYAHALSKKSDVFLYLAYPGEPALGPAAYVHRPSGFFNPDAPLSHHWVDATHITFGVATLGFRYGAWKIEGSSFTGREPDENRYDFDKPRFDSWSGRLSFNPTAKWALQASHGFIKQPEVLHPGEDVARTTASATYSNRSRNGAAVNATALWGMNKSNGHHAEHAALLEGSYTKQKTVVYSRYEWVQKSVEELNLDEGWFRPDALFPVHALTLGASYDILSVGKTKVAFGVQASLYHPGKQLKYLYGANPVAGEVYLRLYPSAL